MVYPRAGHQAVLLKDGRVLIVGGYQLRKDGHGALGPILDAELYNPSTETFSLAGKMNFFHKEGTVTLLLDGKVLIAGGTENKPYQCPNNFITSEIFDPFKKQFSPVGKMNIPRSGHGATLLPDGKVLITAGNQYSCMTKDRNISNKSSYLTSQELFDPKTGQFSSTPNLQVGHSNPQIVPFSQNEIFAAGRAVSGLTPEKDEQKDVEIYNFSTKKSKYFNIFPLTVNSTKFYAVNQQSILAVNGKGNPNRYFLQLYLLNGQKNKFEREFLSNKEVHGFSPEVTTLPNKSIFILLNYLPGFFDTLPSSHAFRYDFKTHHLQDIGDYPRGPMHDVPIVALKNGKLLLIGGECRIKCTDSEHFTWLYHP